MADFDFELVSPERVLVSDNVEHVVLPGSEGLLGVLAGHSATVVSLKPGMISVLSGSTVTRRIYVRGGFAEINAEGVTVLAEHAIDTDNAEADAFSAELKVAEDSLAAATTDEAKFFAQSAIDTLQAI
ncbi:MAG: F0F1 ATP synthase subunit epsilon [Hyphomicrobiaceae bacterium]